MVRGERKKRYFDPWGRTPFLIPECRLIYLFKWVQSASDRRESRHLEGAVCGCKLVRTVCSYRLLRAIVTGQSVWPVCRKQLLSDRLYIVVPYICETMDNPRIWLLLFSKRVVRSPTPSIHLAVGSIF